MRLTAFSDYSLRVLIYLAAEPGRRATIGEIARDFGVSRNHLMKVVNFLGRHGWLQNLRGRGGGLCLALPPERIVVGQVVRATEGPDVPAECFEPGGADCAIARACLLRSALGRAVQAFHAELDRWTLADLVPPRSPQAAVVLSLRGAMPSAASGRPAGSVS